MATYSVQQSGGDFSTLASALSDASTVANDIFEIKGSWTVDDTTRANVVDDNITIRVGAGGDKSDTSYHDGVYNTANNHYRLINTTEHCMTVANTGCVIDGLAISQDSTTGASDEGISVDANITITIKNCIIRATNNHSQQDGIHMGNSASGSTINIENCIIYDWGRGGFLEQLTDADTSATININSSVFYNCDRQSQTDGGNISIKNTASGMNVSVNIFNTISMDAVNDTQYYQNGTAGTVTWGISYSIDSGTNISTRDSGGTGNLESRADSFGSSAGGDEVIFVSTSDFHLVDDATNNDAQDAHSETGPIEGLSLPTKDIDDETRDTASGKVDIGADAFPAAGGVTTRRYSLTLTGVG